MRPLKIEESVFFYFALKNFDHNQIIYSAGMDFEKVKFDPTRCVLVAIKLISLCFGSGLFLFGSISLQNVN